jgi:hypothetical protein
MLTHSVRTVISTTNDERDGRALRWSAATHGQHAGGVSGRPRSVLLDRAWSYAPATCPTGLRVVALPVGGGMSVCPLCGLRTT